MSTSLLVGQSGLAIALLDLDGRHVEPDDPALSAELERNRAEDARLREERDCAYIMCMWEMANPPKPKSIFARAWSRIKGHAHT